MYKTTPNEIDAFPDNAYAEFKIHVSKDDRITAILSLSKYFPNGRSNHEFTLKQLVQRLEIFDIVGENKSISQEAIDKMKQIQSNSAKLSF